MSEHTPGPWTKECGVILDSRRNIVASRWSWRHADKDEGTLRSDEAIHPVEADANCRLIAAAPELLAMLEVVSKRFHLEIDGGHQYFPGRALIDDIDAAIAAASPS